MLFYLPPMVDEVQCWTLFWYALLCVLHLDEEQRAGCIDIIVFSVGLLLMFCGSSSRCCGFGLQCVIVEFLLIILSYFLEEI